MSTPADAVHPNPELSRRLSALYALNRHKPIDLGFRPPYMALLEALGDPYRRLPPVIHVAGTNGKGSTIAFMRAAIEAAGRVAHAYTSPHLVRFNERIVLQGREIEDDALIALLDEVMAANADRPVTFFEVTTALAFLAFARAPADVLLLEVGMGGRLDCTNVVEAPAVCVITPIGLDHEAHLGTTLAAIAGEKAGIMKPSVPCIAAPQPGGAEVEDVLIARAKAVGAPLRLAGRDWTHDPLVTQVAMVGAHQRDNAATAIETLKTLDILPLENDPFRKSMTTTSWPGRLQRIDLEDIPGGWEVWADGGHNADAGRALAAWMGQNGSVTHAIIGMKADKDPDTFLTQIRGSAASVRFAPIPGPSHAFPGMRPWAEQVRAITREHKPPGRVLIAGSLYLVGDVLQNAATRRP